MSEIHSPWLYASKEPNTRGAHISTLRKFLSAIPDIVPKDSDLVFARFWHPGFQAGNVYVDDHGGISSIIDWQSSLVSPLFIDPNPPSLLDYRVEMEMELPNNYDGLDHAVKDQLQYQVSQSILIHAYETRLMRPVRRPKTL